MVDTNNDPFYPGPWEPGIQDYVRRSVLWPLAQVLHYNHGLFITRCQSSTTRSNITAIVFSVASGLSVLTAKVDGQEISLHRVANSMTGHYKEKDFLKSKNYRYVAQKLGDVTSQAGEEITKLIKDAEENFFPRLYHAMSSYSYRRQANAPSLTVEDLTDSDSKRWLFKMALEHVSEDQVPSAAMLRIKQTWEKIVVQQKLVSQYEHQVQDFFDKDKYVVGWLGIHDHIMVGCVNTAPLIKLAMAVPGSGTPDARLVPIIPFRIYKDLDSVDPAFKDNLMASLAFYKVNREASKVKHPCIDPQGFIPQGNYLWSVVGSMIWTSEEQQWMVLDKIS